MKKYLTSVLFSVQPSRLSSSVFSVLTSALCTLFLVACSSGSSDAPSPGLAPAGLDNVSAQFIYDGKGGLFNNVKWYTYDMSTHFIWSHFDVFAIQSNGRRYKIQILNYYNPEDTGQSGYYTLRIQPEGQPTREINLDAAACGNAFNNPDYYSCVENPEENVFTYLDLVDNEVWRMSDAQALTNSKWTMAFKGTEILLNSGDSGPGDVRGALLYRNPSLFDSNNKAIIKKLQENVQSGFGKAEFEHLAFPAVVSYYPPAGVDRVIHEDYWYADVSGERRAKSENWWMLRSSDGLSFSKLNISAVEPSSDGFTIRIQLSVQAENQNGFSAPFEVTLDVPSFENEASHCLDFNTAEWLTCDLGNGQWDLRFTATPAPNDEGQPSSQWSIQTRNGAFGPLESEQIHSIVEWQ